VSVVLGLLAALAYGISDFLGGIASRRARAITVLVYSYPIGAALMAGLLLVFPGRLSAPTVLWSLGGGACGFVGVLLMYSAMAIAPLNVVSPVTATCTAAVPVLWGVLSGERPALLGWLGIAVGFASIGLVSRTPRGPGDGPGAGGRAIVLALVAGLGFGAYFICLAHSGHDSGMWPVVIARLFASVLCVLAARRARALTPLPRGAVRLTVFAGLLDASANGLFLLASRDGYLSLAGILTALYPAGTVALAVVILKERTGRVQRVGFGLAAASVLLLTTT
jgi:drug/metabolite transporter (DMT)-like permease